MNTRLKNLSINTDLGNPVAVKALLEAYDQEIESLEKQYEGLVAIYNQLLNVIHAVDTVLSGEECGVVWTYFPVVKKAMAMRRLKDG